VSYSYQNEREKLFTEDGVQTLVAIRDKVRKLLEAAGAFRADAAWRGISGDSWTMLAALDYLVERGEIRRVATSPPAAGQHQIFAAPPRAD